MLMLMLIKIMISRSDIEFSSGNFLFNIFTELFEGNSLSVESSNCVNNFSKLFIIESISELFVDVSELVDSELPFSLQIIKTEIGSSCFLAEWISLMLLNQLQFLRLRLSRSLRS